MIKSITATWFETKVRYPKVTESGDTKEVTELYSVDALSFTECESKITEYIAQYVNGDFRIMTEGYASYREVMLDEDNNNADKYYRAKVNFITIDEKSGAEKRSAVTYLVQGADLEGARKSITQVFNDSMLDYEIVSVSETKVVDVIKA